MTEQELASKKVVELRQIAKANGIPLGAGLSKDTIITKITVGMEKKGGLDNITDPTAPAEKPANEPQKAVPEVIASKPAAQQAPAQTASAQPQFRAAWHNPSPRPTMRPQQYQQPKPAAPVQNPQRVQTPYQDSRQQQRPATVAPRRFGPDAEIVRADDSRNRRNSYEPSERSTYTRENIVDDFSVENAMPTVAEIISAGDCVDVLGYLELGCDGTGFIRTGLSVCPTNDDAFVSAVQVSRYGLRTGDLILGKASSQRVSGKIHPLLFVTEINSQKAEEKIQRSDFAGLTAAYPVRNYELTCSSNVDENTSHLISMMNPMGAGQRSIVFTPDSFDDSDFLQNFAAVISSNNPEIAAVMLMISGRDEDAVTFRKKPGFSVFSASFDVGEHDQLHMSEIALEYAKRLCENRRDVLLVVDDFSTLASLGEKGVQKAKEIFSCARRLAEGGSLTVVSSMKSSDTLLCSAFRKAANHWLNIEENTVDTMPARVRSCKMSGR